MKFTTLFSSYPLLYILAQISNLSTFSLVKHVTAEDTAAVIDQIVVMYSSSRPVDVWTSGTRNEYSIGGELACSMELTIDGDLVVEYYNEPTDEWYPKWDSKSSNSNTLENADTIDTEADEYYLHLQKNNGNLVVYKGYPTYAKREDAIWASNTGRKDVKKLSMNDSCDLILEADDGTVEWTTEGRSAVRRRWTWAPTAGPSVSPSSNPSAFPSIVPSMSPSFKPSAPPSSIPTLNPSLQPSNIPTAVLSLLPSGSPSTSPSTVPSIQSSTSPTFMPSSSPSTNPTLIPSNSPSSIFSSSPSFTPSIGLSSLPSLLVSPTLSPFSYSKPTSRSKDDEPSMSPSDSFVPTSIPTSAHTLHPSAKEVSVSPTNSTYNFPSNIPSSSSSLLPTNSSYSYTPSSAPTMYLSKSMHPTTLKPTDSTQTPTISNDMLASYTPSQAYSNSSDSNIRSSVPTMYPSKSMHPTTLKATNFAETDNGKGNITSISYTPSQAPMAENSAFSGTLVINGTAAVTTKNELFKAFMFTGSKHSNDVVGDLFKEGNNDAN